MLLKPLRRLLALLIVPAYLGATVIAATSPVGACPALEGRQHAAHHHAHVADQRSSNHPHHRNTPTNAGECLKCCIAACVVAPCLPGPAIGVSQYAFVGTPVLYWAVSTALLGRAIAPDPGPPKPIA